MNAIPLPGILMAALAVVCVLILLAGLRTVLRRTGLEPAVQSKIFSATAIAVSGWLILLGTLSYNGFFAHFNTLPPRPALVILLPLPFVVIIAFSKRFKTLLLATPPQWLVVFQSFRIVVELLLWHAFVKGLLPLQMTFEGRNFDIAAGILGIIAGWALLQRKPWSSAFAISYNFIGLALLLNILTIAILSMPTSIRYFMNRPDAAVIAKFPFIYLPGVLVVLAYSLHIFSLRQLWIKKSGRDRRDSLLK